MRPPCNEIFGATAEASTGNPELDVSPHLRAKPGKRSFLDAASVIELVETSISSRRPFSFVRLGDGEGSLLGFSTDGASRDDRHYLQLHFEEKSSDADILLFQDHLTEAIASADLIGIRDDVWNASPGAENIDADDPDFFDDFLKFFPLRDVERETLPLHGARRILMLRRWLVTKAPNRFYCSQWANADLQLRGYWARLISSQARIGLIGHSRTLGERIAQRFGTVVDFFGVPNGRDRQKRAPCCQHSTLWPAIAHSIPSNLRGQVFLIGAGLIGKHYCHVVKTNGGIALDVGALMDAWDGLATRGLVYHDKAPLTASKFGPPPEFQLLPHRPVKPQSRKRIFLHAGFSKTGTTAIQKLLHNNEEALATSRVCYVDSGRNNGVDINHHQFARALGVGERFYDQPPPSPDLKLAAKLLGQIDEEVDGTDFDTYLLSSELLTNFSLPRTVEDMFLNWLHDRNVIVLLYLRPQFEWLVSWHMQAAKNGNMGYWLDEFMEDPLALPNSERFDGNFLRKAVFYGKNVSPENIVLGRYDAHDTAFVRSFCERIGLDVAKMKALDRRENVSPPEDRLIKKILVRRAQTAKKDLPLPSNDLPSLCDRAFLRGAYASERERLKAQVQRRYVEINDEIERTFRVRI